jgi:RNA polymerase sigma-70 factor (ECF subfamily)
MADAHNPGTLVTEVYASALPSVIASLLRLTRDRALAEDLAHEAFVRLFIIAADPARYPTEPLAWLHVVARNLAVSHARHQRVASRVGALGPGATWRSAEDTAMARMAGDLALASLAALHPDARAVLVLGAAGYSAREISMIVGRTPLATRSLACRARRRLRDESGWDLGALSLPRRPADPTATAAATRPPAGPRSPGWGPVPARS